MKQFTMKEKRELACTICQATGRVCDRCPRNPFSAEPIWLDKMLQIAQNLLMSNVRIIHEPDERIITNDEYSHLMCDLNRAEEANEQLKAENKRLNDKLSDNSTFFELLHR